MNIHRPMQRKEKNLQNVQARYRLLKDAQSLDDLPSVVVKALSGQRAFAALSIPSLNIYPLALNTLKRLADELYPRPDVDGYQGFKQLNSFRMKFLLLLSKEKDRQSKKPVLISIDKEKWLDIIHRLEASEKQNMHKTRAYYDLFTRLNTLVKSGVMEEPTRLRLYQLLDSHYMQYSRLFAPEVQGDNNGSVADFLRRK
ncbi:hypothetical protein ACVOPT_004370 [Enterobacter hormaechei]